MPLVPPVPRRRLRALAAAAALCAAPALAQQPWDVSLRDGLLSIRANGAPMTELAAALADETGVSFVVTGDAGTPVTTEIVDEPLARAIAKLSPNHLLVKDGESEDASVVEVVLMLDDAAGGGGGGDGFLPSGAPADEIVGSEELLPLDESGFSDSPEADVNELSSDGNYADTPDGLPAPDDGLAPVEEAIR